MAITTIQTMLQRPALHEALHLAAGREHCLGC
jgi:hypothetical protein